MMMISRSGNGIRSAMQCLHSYPSRHIHTLTAAVSSLRVNRNDRYHGGDDGISNYNISMSSFISRRSVHSTSKENNDNAANVDVDKDTKIRLTTLRLYRMLQRSCRDPVSYTHLTLPTTGDV